LCFKCTSATENQVCHLNKTPKSNVDGFFVPPCTWGTVAAVCVTVLRSQPWYSLNPECRDTEDSHKNTVLALPFALNILILVQRLEYSEVFMSGNL
jgi:hypothetical protein